MSKLTREEFKALKRERLLVASLVEEINYKHELELTYFTKYNGTYVHVYSFIEGVPQSLDGEYTFNSGYIGSIDGLRKLQTILQTILNTGEFPND